MSTAVITEPTGKTDGTAGRKVGAHLDSKLCNIHKTATLQMKVKNPDKETKLIIPKHSDLKPVPL